MPFLENHTPSFVNFLGCCYQTQYSIFQCEFSFLVTRRNLVCGRFCEYKGCETYLIYFMSKSQVIRGERTWESIVMVEHPFFLSSNLSFFLSLPLAGISLLQDSTVC
jgi:hypothetical protein